MIQHMLGIFYKQNKLFPVFYKSLKWKEKLSCMTLINSVWYHCYCIFIRDYRFIIMFSIKEVDMTSLWLSKEIYRRLYFCDDVHVCIEIVLTTCLNSLIILFDSVQTYLICNKDLWYTWVFFNSDSDDLYQKGINRTNTSPWIAYQSY